MIKHRYGKLPARPDAVKFRFGAFFNSTKLPTPPLRFGHYNLPIAWGDLGNDKHSDCVFAGAAHETMVWCNEAGTQTNFSDDNALSDYSAVTGFDPSNPMTDQGADMSDAASYRRKTGIVDATGKRHKVDSYVALRPGDIDQLMLATYLTGACGVGIRVPDSAEPQFNDAQPWSVVQGSSVSGGHYIPIIGRNRLGNLLCVTWGRLHAMTPQFYSEFCDEAICYISIDALNAKGVTAEGFNADQLRQDIAALAA